MMLRYLLLIEPLLYILAFGFGAWRGFEELHLHFTEKEPTRVHLSEIDKEWDGEQWVKVHGRLLWEHRHVKGSRVPEHEGKDQVYVYVPLVEPNWRAGQPIRVIVTFGPMPRSRLQSWLTRQQQHPFGSAQGLRRDFGNPKVFFPNLTFAEDVWRLNEGTEPAGLLAGLGFTLLCLIVFVLLVRRARKLRHLWR